MPYKDKEQQKLNQKKFYLKHKDDPEFKRKNREYAKKTYDKYALKNRDKILERRRAGYIELVKNNPAKKCWIAAKSRSVRKGLEFNLSIEDIIIPEFCPVLGIPLFFSAGKKTDNTPSVDRVDNSKGYVKGNVRVISNKANTLKSSMSLEELKKIVQYIEDHLKEN